mmetsp:Transcript_3762/g.11463  ORF Transcript_3762/g.11463 Transcript_3762/m.11463 type:complete len:206 (+) Transcript_3762:641-1258(+)
MIMSVSTFWMSSGAARPTTWTSCLSLTAAAAAPDDFCAAAAGRLMTGPDLSEAAFTDMSARRGTTSVDAAVMAAAAAASSCKSRMSARRPATAAAAAMAGETRCVRPPLPWRPSKLRFDVEAHRSCGLSLSGFMARHMLHPGSRHSKPASMRILSRPSASACALTRPEPGTTMAVTLWATLRPAATAATARMSSMRPLVQLPTKT